MKVIDNSGRRILSDAVTSERVRLMGIFWVWCLIKFLGILVLISGYKLQWNWRMSTCSRDFLEQDLLGLKSVLLGYHIRMEYVFYLDSPQNGGIYSGYKVQTIYTQLLILATITPN